MAADFSEYQIASDFANQTSCSVFITGKAGTGKTTFLKELKKSCPKNLVVVAPTGVAAINAGGVTLHSFFSLPFTPFVPTPEGRTNLIRKQRVNNIKKNIYKELELLIIDEISMVRADLLDAVDTILRHHRHEPNKPFGGIQTIFIGDLYQLPPVVKDEEWQLLSQYYASPFFFHSKVISEFPPVYLELKHIFRQNDKQFINLLNEIRHNEFSDTSKALIRSKINRQLYGVKRSDYIVLTTHNYKANSINSEEMSKIKSPEFVYEAKVSGDFPEKNYPNEPTLTLKKGARVMFIANDRESPHRYFNGKIGTVTELDNDKIMVRCDDSETEIKVAFEVWENISYNVDSNTKQIEEEVLGTYKQYPLRLAWAITVHKSQGLTFDRAILDLEQAFAAGQVYVALSRCRSIDGIVLQSGINQRALSIDKQILEYTERQTSNEALPQILENEKIRYQKELLLQLFDINRASNLVQELLKDYTDNRSSYSKNTLTLLQKMSALFFETGLTLKRIQTVLQQQVSEESLQQYKELLHSRINDFETEVLKISAISSDADLAEAFVGKLLKCCEEMEWRKYVVENAESDLSGSSIAKYKQLFFSKFRQIQEHSKFYIKLSERLKVIYMQTAETDDSNLIF